MIEKDFRILDTFLTGSSYRRSAPLTEADIDIFVVLDPRYYSADGQKKLLENVCAAWHDSRRDERAAGACDLKVGAQPAKGLGNGLGHFQPT